MGLSGKVGGGIAGFLLGGPLGAAIGIALGYIGDENITLKSLNKSQYKLTSPNTQLSIGKENVIDSTFAHR